MPDLNEFFNKQNEKIKPSNLEELGGIRPCSKCDEDVEGAFWDALDMIMSWTCSRGHETVFKVE